MKQDVHEVVLISWVVESLASESGWLRVDRELCPVVCIAVLVVLDLLWFPGVGSAKLMRKNTASGEESFLLWGHFGSSPVSCFHHWMVLLKGRLLSSWSMDQTPGFGQQQCRPLFLQKLSAALPGGYLKAGSLYLGQRPVRQGPLTTPSTGPQ